MINFFGKKYLVMGGTSGIGLQVAKDICDNNGSVVIVGSNQKKLDRALQLISSKVIGMTCDLRHPENVGILFNDSCINQIAFDGLVYCAGISPLMKIEENDCSIMKDVFSINCLSFIETVKHFILRKDQTKPSSIVAISSIAATQSVNRQSAYSGSKAALEAVVRCAAKELLNKNTRVNAIGLGAVRTELFESLEVQNGEIINRYPLGSIPMEEVSHLIQYLLSDKFSHITGSIIKMDSGHDVWLKG